MVTRDPTRLKIDGIANVLSPLDWYIWHEPSVATLYAAPPGGGPHSVPGSEFVGAVAAPATGEIIRPIAKPIINSFITDISQYTARMSFARDRLP
jgi:hypothetical protein